MIINLLGMERVLGHLMKTWEGTEKCGASGLDSGPSKKENAGVLVRRATRVLDTREILWILVSDWMRENIFPPEHQAESLQTSGIRVT